MQNEPWELENPVLAQTLVEALQLDPETLANETEARAANVARSAASNRAARAAASAARRSFAQVVVDHLVPAQPAAGDGAQPVTCAEAPGVTPEATQASPQTSQMSVTSEVAAPGAPTTSTQSQTASPDHEAAAESPGTARAFSQASSAAEPEAAQPQAAFLGQNDVFDFTQPAGVSGLAFTRPKRPAPAQEASTESPGAASAAPWAAPVGEVAATRPKTTKSGKAVAKTRWVEPPNVVATAAAAAGTKMATGIPEPEGAAATAQHSGEPWARLGGKRTKKVRPPPAARPPAPLLSRCWPLSPPLSSPPRPGPPVLWAGPRFSSTRSLSVF